MSAPERARVLAVVLCGLLLTGCSAQDRSVEMSTSSGSTAPAHPTPTAAPAPPPERPARVPEDAEPVVVTALHDGDTVSVRLLLDGALGKKGAVLRSRLLHIDAPEVRRFNEPAECFARQASERLASLMPIGSLQWAARDEGFWDRYRRPLLLFWSDEDSRYINRAMVRRGFARSLQVWPNERLIEPILKDERTAQRLRVGLWEACRGAARATSRR